MYLSTTNTNTWWVEIKIRGWTQLRNPLRDRGFQRRQTWHAQNKCWTTTSILTLLASSLSGRSLSHTTNLSSMPVLKNWCLLVPWFCRHFWIVYSSSKCLILVIFCEEIAILSWFWFWWVFLCVRACVSVPGMYQVFNLHQIYVYMKF